MKIFLTSAMLLVGMAVFSQGVGSWKFQYLPFYRHVNSAWMFSQNSFVTVGGSEANDKIRAITKSTDGGQNFQYTADQVDSSWLRSVYFTNSLIGYAVGYEGLLLKTTDAGLTWNRIPLTGNFASRNYNAVYFTGALTGYMAGGNKSNDSIQTILKTTDGGNTWSPQRDAPGPWLKDIYFIDQNTGFAVGEAGVVLKTTNGGGQWNVIALTGNMAQRTYNCIRFADNSTGVMAGGNQANDSVQTVLRSTDGGNTWNIIADSIGPWLNALQFYNSANGYLVGDDGTLLSTTDKGLTWNRIILPDSVNDKGHLNAVYFINQYFGMVSGEYSKTIFYITDSMPGPLLTVMPVTFLTPVKVALNGMANNNGGSGASQIIFEYDTTYLLGDTIIANPASISGSQNTTVSAIIDNLVFNKTYYYRIKAVNTYGIYYSSVDSFTATHISNEIENWGFEIWDTAVMEVPTQWAYMGNVKKAASFDGGNAIQLASFYGGEDANVYKFSVLLYGTPGDNDVFAGGVPFTSRADSLKGYFKYDINPGDTAVIILILKTAGNIIANNIFKIAGSSAGNFVPLSFPIAYSAGGSPDSVIIGFVNSNPFAPTGDSGSTLTIDKISFSGTALNVPNADFEDWANDVTELPRSWASGKTDALKTYGLVKPVSKTTDRYSGDYALKITDNSGGIGVYLIRKNQSGPTIALKHKPTSFNGFYKYNTQTNDTFKVIISVYYMGAKVAGGVFIGDATVTQFTPFTLPLNYYSFAGTPDSAQITIDVGNEFFNKNNELIIDALSFDGFIGPGYVDTVVITGMQDNEMRNRLVSYPNPVGNTLYLKLPEFQEGKIDFEIFDMNGQLMEAFTMGDNFKAIDVSKFATGIYIIASKNNALFKPKKFVRLD